MSSFPGFSSNRNKKKKEVVQQYEEVPSPAKAPKSAKAKEALLAARSDDLTAKMRIWAQQSAAQYGGNATPAAQLAAELQRARQESQAVEERLRQIGLRQ